MHVLRPVVKTLLADTLTPVSLYLRLRDRHPGALLLESSDYHGSENSISFLCLEPLAEFVVENQTIAETLPGAGTTFSPAASGREVVARLESFLASFHLETADPSARRLNGFFGYCSYDAVQFFEKIKLAAPDRPDRQISALRYQLPRFVLSVNHFNNRLTLIENLPEGEASRLAELESALSGGFPPAFPFKTTAAETTNLPDEAYLDMVAEGKRRCQRGDVFQIVLARQFSQAFRGDEFNVYRALRSVNPSPYLFFFDCGGYKIFGSSPEAQVRLKAPPGSPQSLNSPTPQSPFTAFINPIAGTFPRSGDDAADRLAAEALAADPKENSEHVMLVDLARNDLNRLCRNVRVEVFREVQFYSHVIHLVSEVAGDLPPGVSAVRLLSETFPAGTLSGAPKHRAMQLIDEIEPHRRGFYGGCVGFFNFAGETNHAILIRSFLSKNNVLHFQAGAGVVKSSVEEKELQEVNHKISALRKAIAEAEKVLLAFGCWLLAASQLPAANS